MTKFSPGWIVQSSADDITKLGKQAGIQSGPESQTFNVNNTKIAQPITVGTSGSSGSSGGHSAQSSRSEALVAMLLQQQQLAEQRLRAQMQAANEAIDNNANYAIEQMEQDRIDQQRQSYISKEKSLAALPQASLAMGGGGLSETSLMGVNSEYEGAMNDLVNTFNRNKGDVLNEAANMKASNELNLANQIMDFENSTSQNLMELAQSGDIEPSILSMAMLSLGDISNSYSSYIARLHAAGWSDEQIRAAGVAF